MVKKRFGETYYVQEHQAFVVSQLEELSKAGYRIIFQESFYSFNWMIEDYINGELDELPEFILYFDELLINGIKSFNSTVPEAERIQLVYMDLNLWTTNFSRNVTEIEKILGQQKLLSEVSGFSSNSMLAQTELIELIDTLGQSGQQYIDQWGEKWYQRIMDILRIELTSIAFRTDRSDRLREATMFENIQTTMNQNPNLKCVVNTGFNHAQKMTHFGRVTETITTKLDNVYNGVSSIIFIGLEGERKGRFDGAGFTFDLISNADTDDMVLALGD